MFRLLKKQQQQQHKKKERRENIKLKLMVEKRKYTFIYL